MLPLQRELCSESVTCCWNSNSAALWLKEIWYPSVTPSIIRFLSMTLSRCSMTGYIVRVLSAKWKLSSPWSPHGWTVLCRCAWTCWNTLVTLHIFAILCIVCVLNDLFTKSLAQDLQHSYSLCSHTLMQPIARATLEWRDRCCRPQNHPSQPCWSWGIARRQPKMMRCYQRQLWYTVVESGRFKVEFVWFRGLDHPSQLLSWRHPPLMLASRSSCFKHIWTCRRSLWMLTLQRKRNPQSSWRTWGRPLKFGHTCLEFSHWNHTKLSFGDPQGVRADFFRML